MSLLDESSQVPLIISVPGQKPAVCHSFVELLDLYPSLAAMCGLPAQERLQGKDISPMLQDPTHTVRSAAFSVAPMRKGFLLREDDWAFIQYGEQGQNGTELYHIKTDPRQYTNLAAKPAHAKTVARFRKQMAAKLAAIRDNDLPRRKLNCGLSVVLNQRQSRCEQILVHHLAAALPIQAADYLRDIKPVLKARCYACHGALKQKAGLRVDSAANLRKGAKGADVLSIGKPGGSELLARLAAADADERMPPEGAPLKPAEIAAIREWIAAGAPVPAHESAEADPREHWAFQVPQLVKLPGDAGNPVDVLLEQQRASRGLKAQPIAERTIRLRRLYLDLIGLPPTRAQLADTRPWNVIVDELLKSPHHGERWARHWMDIWRYTAGTGSARNCATAKNIWHCANGS